ncbi:hypothetical protein DICA4_A01794 [Diutina catenulata]
MQFFKVVLAVAGASFVAAEATADPTFGQLHCFLFPWKCKPPVEKTTKTKTTSTKKTKTTSTKTKTTNTPQPTCEGTTTYTVTAPTPTETVTVSYF